MQPGGRWPLLGPRAWEEIRSRAERLEEAWQRSGDVDLIQFLPPPGDPLRPAIFEELLKTDLEIRWRRGRGVGLRDYLNRYPELAVLRNAWPGLLYEEFRVRHRFGDRPAVEGYRETYPELFPAFQRLLQESPVPQPRPPDPEPPSSAGPIAQQGHLLPVGGAGYRLLARIGLGGFGEVWKAEAPGGMPVAIKFINRPLDQEDAQRELRSLEIIRELKNPFLLRTQAFWASSDRLIVVMDLADGSLRDRLKECQKENQRGIPGPELLGYFEEAAEALDYMHGKGVLHRDVKPDNVLLREGRVLVADFGLVRQSVPGGATLSSSGTPPYMAPEAWSGKPVAASDQYSLACTWVELRLGRRPFTGDNAEVVLRALTATPDLQGLPTAEARAIHRALEKEPKNRYPSCSAMVSELEKVLALAPDLAPVPATLHTPGAVAVGGAAWPAAPVPPQSVPEPPDPDALAPDDGDQDLEDMVGTIPSANVSIGGAARKRRGGWQSSDTDEMSGAGWRLPPKKKTGTPGYLVGILLLIVAVGALLAFVGYAWYRPGATASATESVPDPGVPAPKNGEPDPGGPPPKPVPAIMPPPDGFVAVGEDTAEENGLRYPKRIRSKKTPNDRLAEFVLVQHRNNAEPATVYLMENKLCNAVYDQFAKEDAKAAGLTWLDGGLAGGKRLGNKDPKLPVLAVTRPEAEAAAKWLGGRLPKPEELDMAAGFWQRDGREGPARGPRVAVRLYAVGPSPVDDRASDDISPLDVRDLAGNGEEWTSATIDKGGEPAAVLRGRSYLAPDAKLFEDIQRNQELPPTQLPGKAAPWTGFRVAVDLPQKGAGNRE